MKCWKQHFSLMSIKEFMRPYKLWEEIRPRYDLIDFFNKCDCCLIRYIVCGCTYVFYLINLIWIMSCMAVAWLIRMCQSVRTYSCAYVSLYCSVKMLLKWNGNENEKEVIKLNIIKTNTDFISRWCVNYNYDLKIIIQKKTRFRRKHLWDGLIK